MNEIKVLIADDHAIVRMGLVALLEAKGGINVVGEAQDGEETIRKAQKLNPDVVIMDLMMPVLDGIEATRRLKALLPQIKIIILTTSTISDDLSHAIEAGADGALTKSTDTSALLKMIKDVVAGKTVISHEISEFISQDPPAPELTQRQLEILHSITRGFTTAEIAKQLGIGSDCVKDHINAIMIKMGAANRTEAVAIALRKHLLKI